MWVPTETEIAKELEKRGWEPQQLGQGVQYSEPNGSKRSVVLYAPHEQSASGRRAVCLAAGLPHLLRKPPPADAAPAAPGAEPPLSKAREGPDRERMWCQKVQRLERSNAKLRDALARALNRVQELDKSTVPWGGRAPVVTQSDLQAALQRAQEDAFAAHKEAEQLRGGLKQALDLVQAVERMGLAQGG